MSSPTGSGPAKSARATGSVHTTDRPGLEGRDGDGHEGPQRTAAGGAAVGEDRAPGRWSPSASPTRTPTGATPTRRAGAHPGGGGPDGDQLGGRRGYGGAVDAPHRRRARGRHDVPVPARPRQGRPRPSHDRRGLSGGRPPRRCRRTAGAPGWSWPPGCSGAASDGTVAGPRHVDHASAVRARPCGTPSGTCEALEHGARLPRPDVRERPAVRLRARSGERARGGDAGRRDTGLTSDEWMETQDATLRSMLTSGALATFAGGRPRRASTSTSTRCSSSVWSACRRARGTIAGAPAGPPRRLRSTANPVRDRVPSCDS